MYDQALIETMHYTAEQSNPTCTCNMFNSNHLICFLMLVVLNELPDSIVVKK